MSDFLNQFTKENYDRKKMKIQDVIDESVETVKIENIKEIDVSRSEVIDAKDIETENVDTFIEDLNESLPVDEEVVVEVLDQKHERKLENDYIRDEETELDPEYKKKRRNKIILITTACAVAFVSIGFIYFNSSRINMPDFVNVTKQEVVSWANKNKMQVIYEEQFSLDIEADLIIEQSVEPNTKVKKGSDLKMMVSTGADPDELVAIPEFKTMKASEIESWVADNKMRYIQVEYVFSEDVEKDTFISFEITDKDVSKDKFMRKNKGVITISKGEETYEKDITVINFKGKTKEEVETWMKDKEFVSKFVFEEAYDDKIMEGTVISQDAEVGSKIAKNDVITFTISKGKAILAPSYYGTELSTFDTIQSSAPAISKEWYTMELGYGAFMSQSIAAGTVLNDVDDAIIVVYYSIGKPYIKGIEDLTEGDLPQYFYEYQSKGADLSYSVVRIKDCAMKGSVVRSSHSNEYVSTSQHITVYISDGTGTSCGTPEE